MDDERVVRELAATLPEAFDGIDLEDEFFYDEDECWLTYSAMGRAREWVEDRGLKIRWGGRVAGVRAGAEEALTRLFAYVEQLVSLGDDDARTLVFVELFEGAVWVEQIADRLGPRTRELLGQSGLSET